MKKKKLLALLISVVVFALIAVVSAVFYATVPKIVLGGFIMALCLGLCLFMVWLCVYEAIGGN